MLSPQNDQEIRMKFGIFYEHQLPRPWTDGAELKLFQDALSQATGNISQAARILGLTRRGLYLKLQRLGLEAKNKTETSVN